jgi:preprotein translocase subunit SecY
MASAAEQIASNFNLGAFAKAEELKKRIWFTLGALVVYRLGTYIPMPGINPDALAETFKQAQGGILGLFNMFCRISRHRSSSSFSPRFRPSSRR